MRRFLSVLALGCLFAFSAGTRARGEETNDDERQLEEEHDADETARERVPVGKETNDAERQPAEKRDADEETARALERVLVQRGALVLRPWLAELEPLVAYGYREQDGLRRDTFSSSLTLRLGLPWAAQGEVRLPFVLYDRQSGAGTSSGLGDVTVGLTKLLIMERESVPELLFTARWKTTTGSSDGQLPTGSGAHGLQWVLTAVKRIDPLVLLGSAYYVWNIRSGDVALGDALGVILAVILAATPETSVLLDVDVASFSATVAGGQPLAGTDRLSGILEIGVSTIVARDLLLNVIAGVGVTPAAPDLRLAVSVPFRL